jgi:signal transduction histidine kinase
LVKKARAEAILNNISCGIVAMDADARITSVNHFAESALDVSSGELIGKSVQKLGSVVADAVLRTIKDDQPVVNRPYRDGATGRVFAITTCRMYDERSNVLGAILFFTALSEAVPPVSGVAGGEGLREFVELEGGMFAAFSAHIADKIKNPLASIKTFSQLLPEKFDDQEFRQKFSEVVGKAVERINSLADGLTAYAETGPLDLSPTNIAAVVDNAVAALRNSLRNRKLSVVRPGPEKPAMVLVDGRLMRSAFLNVLKNSIESTPPNGTITVSIKEVAARELRNGRRENASRVLLDSTGISGRDGMVPDDEIFVETEFRDSGKGIPEAEIGELGEPFFTTRGGNVGLGLAITRRIVSRHRGRMEIESKEGKGTTVWIILPQEQNTP